MVDNKPCLHLCVRDGTAGDKLKGREHAVKVVNVAGPRREHQISRKGTSGVFQGLHSFQVFEGTGIGLATV
jgi:hypothetical protein